jgi:uncharacterized protein
MTLYLDADACPVKNEAYRVAARYSLRIVVAANCEMKIPTDPLIELVVKKEFGEVDDWIVEQAKAGDIVVTADIPLAARCLGQGAFVLNPRGTAYTSNNIADAIAAREMAEMARAHGEATGGPPPMTPKDRSRFLAKLDETIHAARRTQR